MPAQLSKFVLIASAAFLANSSPAWADDFHFTTGSPDGLIATASGPSSTETADDFLLAQDTNLTSGTFTGLLPAGTDLSNIENVSVEIYRVFPLDSATPPSGQVPTRTNSPSDVAIDSRGTSLGDLSFGFTTLNPNFTAANSVVNGINPLPNVFTGGEGAVSGLEALFTFDFLTSVDLPTGHYFFVPQVQLDNGDFLWLSAPRPPAPNDLQTWIRSDNIAPNWLRIGTDITHQGPFNAAFSLNGSSVPEPSSWMTMLTGFVVLASAVKRTRKLTATNPAIRT